MKLAVSIGIGIIVANLCMAIWNKDVILAIAWLTATFYSIKYYNTLN